MAKQWAKGFYKSKRWQTVRESYIASVHGLCELCGDAGYIVHHITELTPENIGDPDVSLNHTNLQYLCLTCHNQEHGAGNTVPGIRFDEDGNIYEVKPE